MRELNIDFASHIAEGQTNIATCWRIIRNDGVIFGFSDHDEKLTFDGTVFSPSYGMDAGEVASKLGSQVDSSEIVGIVHSEAIDENDILLGKFDGAIVETYKVNWRDVGVRALLRSDTIGEITRTDGVFRLELRSPQHAMNINKGRIYQSLCDCELGDDACSIDIDEQIYKVECEVISLKGRSGIIVSLLVGFEENWFDFGHGIWSSGERDGKRDEIILQSNIDGQSFIKFAETIDEWVSAGDIITLYAGCDRQMKTCTEKFSNILNFRGFAHIPVSDFLLRYPKNGDEHNGGAMFK